MTTAEMLSARLEEVRDRTLGLVAPLDDEWVGRTPDPIMSPPAWDLAHIAAYEELWLVTRLSEQRPLHPDLQATYDAFETPRAVRGEIRILDGRESREYMHEVREKALEVMRNADMSPDGPELTADGFVWAMVAQHEAQHDETLLQTLQLMPPGAYSPCVGALPPGDDRIGAPDPVHIAGGTIVMGAPGAGGALDCEKPAHVRDVAPFRLDRNPVTIGRHLEFIRDGGYHDERLWSAEGWAWRQGEGVEAPLHWQPDGAGGWTRTWFGCTEAVDAAEILCHVSFHEAEAHARWAGGRLPTEHEWEFAARHDPASPDDAWAPWGPARHDGRANLGQVSFRPSRVGAYPDGVAPTGCAHMMGDVWEWTSTEFDAYPGFRAFPYREYAEPFFRDGYRVLRGGSWATQSVAARTTFRNWDLPQRRQIFAGVRVAWDAA
ncbi:MAG: ergothioneine biosynthesis protein EgtB [Actinomycetota bacterium]